MNDTYAWKIFLENRKVNAEFYAKDIKKAELLAIDGADHFTFKNRCSVIGFKLTPNLCPSDNKKALAHNLVVDKIYSNSLLNYAAICKSLSSLQIESTINMES